MPEDGFLASPRKAPVHRRSAASLRSPTSLAGALDAGDDANANGRFSLAHELAVAMMPEPSAGSKLLAEEFGIEFDEGAEGIDDGPQIQIQKPQVDGGDFSFASETDPQLDDAPVEPPDFGGDPQFEFGSPRADVEARPAQDPMEVLAQDLASTDNFLAHLRRLDTDSSSPSSSAHPPPSGQQQPELERLAADVIRRINDTARDREGQVRELLECEREFRRIAGEVGGQDVLGHLEALPEDEDAAPAPAAPLAVIHEQEREREHEQEREDVSRRPSHLRAMSQDWETDPDVDRLGDMDPAFAGDGDADADAEPHASPTPLHPSHHHQHSFSGSAPSSPTAPTTSRSDASPAAQLAALRGLTTTLVAALTSVSEHAQVNGAATAEAGRKLRALRNRLGGWRAEWEGAERSRGRIARWEAGGAWEGEGGAETPTTPVSTPARGAKRVDGRAVVQEHLHAFEQALAEAALKTKAIMAT